MNLTYGRYGSYGKEGGNKVGDQILAIVGSLAPGVGTALEQIYDPQRQVELLTLELNEAIAKGKPASEITELRIKLESAKDLATKQEEAERNVALWRVVGMTALIGVSSAMIFFLVVRALK